MKKYRDLLSELPSKTVVITYSQFNPPSTGHELLVKVVRKLAKQRKADHIVFVSSVQDKKNPLEISKKIQYLELMFPNTKFVASTDDIITSLKKYKNVVAVTSSDEAATCNKLLGRGKFDSVNVVEATDKNPDDNKLIKLATSGDYSSFKAGLPSQVRDLDSKRLMNDVRQGLGLEPIKEQLKLVNDDLREQYFRGKIFNEGDIVESNEQIYKIIKRGSNHLLLQTESGQKVSKWIQDVKQTEREFMEHNISESVSPMPGSTDKEQTKAAADTKMAQLQAQQAKQTLDLKARQAREKDAVKANMKEGADSPVVNTQSKYNIAKSLMSLNDFRKTMNMGEKGVNVDNKETESDIDAMQHATGKASPQSHVGGQQMDGGKSESIRRMRVKYHLGEDAYKGLEKEDKPGKKATEFKGGKNAVTGKTVEGWKDEDIGFKHTKTTAVKEEFEELTEQDILQLEQDMDAWKEEDYLELYEDEELAIIDEETGEFIDDVVADNAALDEVLSRHERVMARARLRRTQAKRTRREKVALRTNSTPEVANKRARRMAISAMKKRLLKGRNPSKISVGEKERVERFIAQRKKVVDRLAARMVSRVKQVEKARFSHKKYTKPNNGVAF